MSDYSLYIAFIYFVTAGTALFTRFGSVKIGNLLAALIAVIAFGAAAFRPSHFPDVGTYEVMFYHASSGDFANPEYWQSHGEPGFKILSYVLQLGGFSYNGFLIFMAILSYVLLIIISKISKVPFSYLWFTYFSFFFVTRDLGVLRLAIASHLVVLAFLQRKLLWQLIILAFASLSFQYYAMVAIAAPILSRFKPNILILIFLMVFTGVVGISGYMNIDLIASYAPDIKLIKGYLGSSYNENRGISTALPIVRNLFFALLLYWLMRKEIKLKKFRIWIWSAFLSVLTYLFFNDILIAAQRFSAYFGVIFPLAFAYLLNKSNLSSFKFFLIYFSVVMNFILLFYYNNFVWLIFI